MKNKHDTVNKQLSLMLEFPPQDVQSVEPTATLSQQRPTGVIITFPARQSKKTDFRERVIQDLIRTRIVVTD